MNDIERPLIDSDLLRSFVVIADCGNLTVAARRLHRTQSAISVQLRRLETDLATALFHRTSRGMTLTDAGTRLLPKARAILAQLREAGQLFDNPLSGAIRVGFPDDFDDTVLEQVLADFARAHPGVRVFARSGCTSDYPSAVRNGSLDMAVCSGPGDTPGELLGIEDTVWAAKRGFHVDGEKPVPLAVLERDCWWRELPTRAFDRDGRAYAIAFRSASFASLLAALRAGFAIGVVPRASVGAGLEMLPAARGFPRLPQSRRTILTGPDAPKALAAAMAEAIRNARTAVAREAPA